MAYTYEDFTEAAKNAGMMDRFGQEDLLAAKKSPEYGIRLLSLMKDGGEKSTAEQRLLAEKAQNVLRKTYSAGAAGNTGYAINGSPEGSRNEAYAQPGGSVPTVGTEGSFQYDPESDPIYSAYRKQYLREGKRATADALAQASAASAGRPSSYALTAAQMAQNYYNAQLTDIIPTLQKNAYQRYLDDVAQKQQQWQNALALYNALGYATPEVAEILGIGKKEENENVTGGYAAGSGGSGGTFGAGYGNGSDKPGNGKYFESDAALKNYLMAQGFNTYDVQSMPYSAEMLDMLPKQEFIKNGGDDQSYYQYVKDFMDYLNGKEP